MSDQRVDDEDDVGPFGIPDGALATPEDMDHDFVSFPGQYGGISRPPSDARVRVVAGRLGAGKSLYLRRMQVAQLRNDAVFAERTARNAADLSSDDIVRFSETVGSTTENTEVWKRLWRAAIFRAAASFLLHEEIYAKALPPDAPAKLATYKKLLGSPNAKRRITHEAQVILQQYQERGELNRYLKHELWSDAEQLILSLLGDTRPLFLYVDAIDDNFKYAPAHWMKCQRGLFYAVMDLLRESEPGVRLHVVIALRDIALASTQASDAGTRYLEEVHVNVLDWSRPAMLHLLQEKVSRLPDRYFSNASNKTVGSWIGLDRIVNRRETRYEEAIEDYLLRHTRLVPRDLVILGNRLSRTLMQLRDGTLTSDHEDTIRDEVASTAGIFVGNQLAQVANQVWSDSMPLNAARHSFENIYTNPNMYQMDAAVDLVMAAMARTQSETFGLDELKAMDGSISDELKTPISLGNILWQNQLLGVVVRRQHHEPEGSYYSLRDYARTTLPLADEFVWNPLVFDLVPGIQPTLSSPMPPRS